MNRKELNELFSLRNCIIISFSILFIYAWGTFVGYHNGVSYATQNLLHRDLLNHIQPEVREQFLTTDFTDICPDETQFEFVEYSTDFGLWNRMDLCFVCKKEEAKIK